MAISLINSTAGAYAASASLTGGNLPSFSFDPGAGSFVVVMIGGYRSSSATLTFNPTLAGVSMSPVGPVEWSNNTNTSNSCYQQWFIASSVSSGSKSVAGTWSGNGGFASPRTRVIAFSFSDVSTHTGFTSTGGSASGTGLSQTFSSSPGNVVVQCYMQDSLSSTDQITDYNGWPIVYPFDAGANGQGAVGYLPGAASVTFTASRLSGADWLTSAFQLVPVGEAPPENTSNMMMVM